MSTRLAALVFDFDGVLVESMAIKGTAFHQLYRPFGAEVAELAVAHHVAHAGLSRRQKIRDFHRARLGAEPTAHELDALCQRFSELVEDAVVACAEVAGAKDVLEDRHRRLSLFVLSGTPQAELARIVQRRGLARYFTEVIGTPPEKPVSIRRLLRQHRWRPRQVLFVGDGVTDFRAARETGVRFLGRVRDGEASPFPPGTPVISDLRQLVV